MKEQRVNKEKLKVLVNKEFMDYVTHNYPYKDDYEQYKDLPRSKWPERLQNLYRNTYSNCYNALRKEVREEKQNFWVTMTGNGILKSTLNKYGLTIDRRGNIVFIGMAEGPLKFYLTVVVIPALEKAFNIKGIKLGKHISPMASNTILNLEDVEINKEESTTC